LPSPHANLYPLAKDMSQYGTNTSPQTRSRARALAPSRPSTSTRRESYHESIASSPEPTEQTRSPEPNLDSTRSSSLGSDSERLSFDDEKEPASGPQRSRAISNASTSAKGEREKRKRSRVTPEQLVHLERFFALDRSPPAARRREISERLGMQERQTQIWFQNRCGRSRSSWIEILIFIHRRAKAKLQDGRSGRGGSTELPPDSPPQLSTGFEVDLHNLIHEDERKSCTSIIDPRRC
jgi:hypothetical protein